MSSPARLPLRGPPGPPSGVALAPSEQVPGGRSTVASNTPDDSTSAPVRRDDVDRGTAPAKAPRAVANAGATPPLPASGDDGVSAARPPARGGGAERVDGGARPRPDAAVPGGTELLSFNAKGEIQGGATAFKPPESGFWDKFVDVLAEIFTLGLADTQTFNHADWRNNAGTAAMAGGPALRQAVRAADTPDKRAALAAHLGEAARRGGAPAGDAKAIGERMLAELQRLYANPKVDDALVEGLQKGLVAMGPGAFGGNPGKWLHGFAERAGNDAAAMQALGALVGDPALQGCDAGTRRCVLAQAATFPEAEPLSALRRLPQAGWFGPLGADDRARATRIMAFTGHIEHTAKNAQQRTIIHNSLDKLLPPAATFSLAFRDEAPHADGSRVLGWGGGGVVTFNSHFIGAGTSGIEDSEATRDLVVDTVAHEVNHNANHDAVAPTFRYFMGEYGAWRVGFIAGHGREPTRGECYDRAVFLLTRTDGAYDSIRHARVDLGPDGKPSAEGQQVIAFMNQFTDRALDVHDAASVNACVGLSVSRGDATGPAPVGRDDDN